MSQYSPNPAPLDADVEALKRWMEDELNNIARARSESDDFSKLKELSALPQKYTDGVTLFISAALSASLGLGGRGIYTYYGGAWNRLG